MTPVKVTARLANELTGAPPQLDGLLIKARCRFHPSAGAHEKYDAAPPMESLPPCPIARVMVGEWLIHRVSSPIASETQGDRHERFSQHFPREHALQLEPGERGVIATTNGAQKSFYLPRRRRVIVAVSWFAVVDESPSVLRRELKRSVTHIGMDRANGHGRVAEWLVETADADYSWFAPHPEGTVLMRQLPYAPDLPQDLIGFVRDFDAVTPPYWHPGRKTEIVRPC